MRPDELAKFDQAAKLLADTMPTMLHGLYQKCVEQGFTETQAMQIVLKYMENFRPVL